MKNLFVKLTHGQTLEYDYKQSTFVIIIYKDVKDIVNTSCKEERTLG